MAALDTNTYALHWTPPEVVQVPRSISLTLHASEAWLLRELRDVLNAKGIAAHVTVERSVTETMS